MRYFKVVRAGNTALNGRIGKLIGDIDYTGCCSGCHTLTFDSTRDTEIRDCHTCKHNNRVCTECRYEPVFDSIVVETILAYVDTWLMTKSDIPVEQVVTLKEDVRKQFS